ncbi:hypothetical protein ACJJTC_011352 [Scirpophaga incertulas]
MKLSRTETLYTEFDELQSQIEFINTPNLSMELTTRDMFEQEFDTYISLARKICKEHSAPNLADTVLSNTSAVESHHCHHEEQDLLVRALLDSGSQSSFITSYVKNILDLTPQMSNINVVDIGGSQLNHNVERCAISLQSNAE